MSTAKHSPLPDKFSEGHKLILPIARPEEPVLPNGSYKLPRPVRPMPLMVKIMILVSALLLPFFWKVLTSAPTSRPREPDYASQILEECRALNVLPTAPPGFELREESDRFVPGTPPTLIRNATIWTGGRNGTEIVYGDLLLDKGLVQAVGYIPETLLANTSDDMVVIEAGEAWVTPGLFDMHSHIGVLSAPLMRGSVDLSSSKGPIQPWDRSLDGFNVHDAALPLSIAGGVTSSLILPGSDNAIGGQAFVVKLRETKEHSPSSMVLELPHFIGSSDYNRTAPPRWRHIKHAVGENPSGAYKQTRMDTAWQYREAYTKAREVKESQDSYCAKAEQSLWNEIPDKVPVSAEWEALVDVLRGKVKVNIHCYTATDFDAMIRLSNEFKFPIAAFHHAHQAFLLTDLLNQTYGGKPAIAMFAVTAGYKIEAYRFSEYAPKILAKKGFNVVMKSDHPVLDSRHLVHEAAQAHYYGLHPALALASVTTTPAQVSGFGHRLGKIKENYDADIVIWDSHPLTLGATPSQVFIDGIAQFEKPKALKKPDTFQSIPRTPNFDEEAKKAVEYQGLPPLQPKQTRRGDRSITVFANVTKLWRREDDTVVNVLQGQGPGVVVVEDGKIKCAGTYTTCMVSSMVEGDVEVVDLEGGSIAPGLIAFGAPLGVEEIAAEPSTNNGQTHDLLSPAGEPSSTVFLSRAADGLSFGGRNALQAYRSGVTTAVTAPVSAGMVSGLSAAFRLGSPSLLDATAIVQNIAALHVSIGHLVPFGSELSVSTQIGTLRNLLVGNITGDAGLWFTRAAKGEIPLVINVANADHMASLIVLKGEVERITHQKMRMVFGVATEAHLIAKEIAQAQIGVILSPPRPFPAMWDQRRMLPGPPLSKGTSFTALLEHKVVVGLGASEASLARNIRFDLGWTALDSNGTMSEEQTMALATTNMQKLLGVDANHQMVDDLVAYRGGGIFDFASKVVGVISEAKKTVDIF